MGRARGLRPGNGIGEGPITASDFLILLLELRQDQILIQGFPLCILVCLGQVMIRIMHAHFVFCFTSPRVAPEETRVRHDPRTTQLRPRQVHVAETNLSVHGIKLARQKGEGRVS